MENNQDKKSFSAKFGEMTRSASFPRLIITVFFIFICILAISQGLPFLPLMSDSLVRFGMNAILVLAMVPAIQCGIGPNFGLPIGILTGLLGTILAFQMGFTGWVGLFMAIILALPFTLLAGYLYGLMLNRVKG
ncbi:MAG: ABC transporter, partial [Clostridiales bacterium]